MNCLVADPAEIVKPVGMLIVAPVTEEPSETGNPPEGAAVVNVTVHCTEPITSIVVALQLSAESATDRVTFTVAATPVPVTLSPLGEAAAGFNT